MPSMVEWQSKIKKFNDDRLWSKSWAMKDFLLAVVEEVGEARNIIKWVPESESPKLIAENKAEWADFIGQLQYLTYKMAYLTDVDAEQALADVMKEFEERFPIDKVKGSHANLKAGGHDGKYTKKD